MLELVVQLIGFYAIIFLFFNYLVSIIPFSLFFKISFPSHNFQNLFPSQNIYMDANFYALLDYIDVLIVILKLVFMNYFGSHSKLPFERMKMQTIEF